VKRWLPSASLSLLLFGVWLLLNQSVEPGTLLTAAVLALGVPLLTRRVRPAAVRVRRPAQALKLMAHVAYDLVISARDVAWQLLTRRTRDIHAHFVRVPLDTRDPNALAVIAMILCLTPGTAWAEVSFDRSTLLVHVFHNDDEAGFIALVKERYERPLMEIFET